ncbi:sugar-binding protein [Catellatospora methionotrophica]|uniref:Sugar-binding protein n=2 Tax=Catellatospora methionotrophica TaxID=121620 RepID=A0A8J3L5R8_9ACTN|nr:sugar-binding protein [Catellatospora methionotrophica]
MTTMDTAPTGGRPKSRGSKRAWLFLSPLLILNGLVVLGPALATVYYAFTDWSGLGPATFIGFDNFTRAFADPAVHDALWHNVIWFVLFGSIPTAMGLLGAYLLSQVKRFQVLFRALYFIPYVVASVVNAAVWKMLLSPTSGIGHAMGIDHAWLGDPDTSLLSVNFVVDWHWWGFLAVVYLAAMQGVDPELYDAAKMDGANRWQQFTSVTLPGIRPTVVFLSLMTVIWTLKAFDYIFIMTGGGPAGSSEVVSTLMYKQAFNEYEAGYAAALGLTMTVIIGFVLAGYQYLKRKGWEE